jgi:GT2 family glycosyltransferase
MKPGSLAALFGFLEADPKAGVAGGRLLNSDKSLQHSCYLAPTLGRELWLLFHLDALYPAYARYEMDKWDLNTPRQVEVLKGACLLLRREAIDPEQIFDEDYFMYSEEVDLCRRIGRAGWLLHWVPQAEIVHHEGQSTRQVATPMFLHLYRAKLLYFRKNGGRRAAQLYKFILLAAALTRLTFSPLAWVIRPAARHQNLALAGRYWQLVRLLPGM